MTPIIRVKFNTATNAWDGNCEFFMRAIVASWYYAKKDFRGLQAQTAALRRWKLAARQRI
jgi:hypothetical protein